jgi:phosphate uptake regulator
MDQELQSRLDSLGRLALRLVDQSLPALEPRSDAHLQSIRESEEDVHEEIDRAHLWISVRAAEIDPYELRAGLSALSLLERIADEAVLISQADRSIPTRSSPIRENARMLCAAAREMVRTAVNGLSGMIPAPSLHEPLRRIVELRDAAVQETLDHMAAFPQDDTAFLWTLIFRRLGVIGEHASRLAESTPRTARAIGGDQDDFTRS